MPALAIILGAENMNTTRKHPRTALPYGQLRWWQVFLALGTILLSGPAPAQHLPILPCQRAQNALRPCTSQQHAASEGHYQLNSRTMAWNDAGTYKLEDSATFVATGRLGTGIWHRVQPKAVVQRGPQRITVRK